MITEYRVLKINGLIYGWTTEVEISGRERTYFRQ